MGLRSLRTIPVVMVAVLLVSTAAVPLVAVAQEQDVRRLDVARDILVSKVGTSLGPPGGEVRSLVMAHGDTDRLYLGTVDGHLYYSNDGGESWALSYAGLPNDATVDNLAVHPHDDDVVFAAYYRGAGTGGLIRSIDGGRSWTPLPVPGDPSLRALSISPSNPEILYVGGLGGVWRSDDAGAGWTFVGDEGKPFQFVESLAVDPRDPDRVYAGTWRQAYRTLDGGRTWQRIHQGMAIDRDVFSVTIDPRNPDALLAGTCNFIYVSGTGGNDWKELKIGLARDHNRVHLVAHDPANANVLYAGTRGALYRSNDGGQSFHIALASVSVTAIQVAPMGLPVYVGTEERGVMMSRDGIAFTEHNEGLNASRVVAFDALPGAAHVLFAARSEGPTQDTLYFSTDIGASWEPLGFGPPLGRIRLVRAQTKPVTRVLVAAERGLWSVRPGGKWAPADPPPGTLHAMEIAHDSGGRVLAATSTGLYYADPHSLGNTDRRSSAFGAGAQQIWIPLTDAGPITSLSIEGTRLLALGPGRAVSGWLAADGDGSQGNGSGGDAVEMLTPRGLPDHTAAVAVDRVDADLAYAVAGHSIFRTIDGGTVWEELELPWPAADLRAVAIDPTHDDQVLALDFRGALYRGHGGGRHWLILDSDPGLSRAWKLRVSAQTPGLALIATQGQGLRVIALDPLEKAVQY